MPEPNPLSAVCSPHAACSSGDPREDFACRLFDRLWVDYRDRVTYVRDYESIVASHGATFFNDHIAFRSIAGASPNSGAAPLARLFVALGYRAVGHYAFEDKHLDAVHYQHANARLPKLFLSELRTWELPGDVREILAEQPTSPEIDMELLAAIASIGATNSGDSILDRTSALFCPKRSEPIDEASLLRVAEVSQYAAWVVLHGASVNHFTSLINSHAVLELDSIEETVAALRAAGVPMKETIEGKPGSKLRQTATAAVDVSVDVRRGAEVVQVPWTYAYFELAERGTVLGAHGQSTRFEGFLGAQATELFEMTRRPSAGPSQS
jgi:hypothetical protein